MGRGKAPSHLGVEDPERTRRQIEIIGQPNPPLTMSTTLNAGYGSALALL